MPSSGEKPASKREMITVEYTKRGRPRLTPAQKLLIATNAKRKIITVDQNGKFLPGTIRGMKTGGRKAGTPNKYKPVRDILKDIGCEPILIIARIAMNQRVEPKVRLDACKELAGFCHGKVKTVDPVDPTDAADKKELTIYIEGAPIPGVKEDFGDVLPSEEKREVIDVTPDK